MDELEISGKRYVSAKRIAKENKYHPDYIGQLIRSGRISGTKVGRAWYVDEASFADYLLKEKGVAIQISTAPIVEPVQVRPVVFEESHTSVASVSPVVVVQTEPAQIEKRVYPESPAVTSSNIQTYTYTPASATRTIPVQKPALTYISDSSPLFPAIPKKIKETPKPISIEHVEIREDYPAIDMADMPAIQSKREGIWRVGFALTSLAVIAGVIFVVTFFGSLGINSTILVEQGKPASVIYAQEKTFCFIFGDCQTALK